MVPFQIAKGFGYRFNIVSRGKGARNCHFYGENRTGWKIPNIVWVFQGLLADIVGMLQQNLLVFEPLNILSCIRDSGVPKIFYYHIFKPWYDI